MNFLLNPDQGLPLTLGGKDKEKFSLKIMDDQMPDAGRQIWEIRVPRDVELAPLKNKMSKNKTKTLKKELRELENQKMMKKERWIKRQWKMIFQEMILG